MHKGARNMPATCSQSTDDTGRQLITTVHGDEWGGKICKSHGLEHKNCQRSGAVKSYRSLGKHQES